MGFYKEYHTHEANIWFESRGPVLGGGFRLERGFPVRPALQRVLHDTAAAQLSGLQLPLRSPPEPVPGLEVRACAEAHRRPRLVLLLRPHQNCPEARSPA